METREILSIVALASLGLCLLCTVAKTTMKNPKAKQACVHACSLLVFVAVVLLAVSQLLEQENFCNNPCDNPGCLTGCCSGECHNGCCV
jgi:hypothetical protein